LLQLSALVRRLIPSVLAVCLAACGGAPSSGTNPPQTGLPDPGPASSPPTPSLPGPGDAELSALLAKIEASTRPLRPYEAVNQVQEWATGKQQRSQSKLLFRPPSTARSEYISGNGPPVGMAVLSHGGPTVQIKLPGALSFVKMTVSSRDSRSRSLVGLYPDEITPASFARLMRQPTARLMLAGRERLGQREVALVRVEGARLPGGMEGAAVGFDARSGEWLLGRFYRGRQLAYESAYVRRVERTIQDRELEL
jgi:hypothetical protein